MTADKVIVFGLEMMADFGIGAMGGAVARACTPENANKLVKACMFVGGVAASGWVATNANNYIESYAEDIKTMIKVVKERNKKEVNVENPIIETEAEIVEETEKVEVEEEEKPKKAKKGSK